MRNPWRWTIGTLVVASALVSFVMMSPVEVVELVSAAEAKQEPTRPKLVVLVVFDQMRGDYLQKWQPLYGEGGFKRLQKEGAWFTNCHYPYAYTLTAPGHTSLVTGTSAYKHGIIANDWYDRELNGDSVSSVTPPPDEKVKGPGPYRRKVEALGDVLLRVLMGRARVASLSIKDRAAILMAALRANLCYWFDTKTGNFRTSAFYRPDPHSWVTKFNKTKSADQWLGKNWERFNLKLDYAKHSGPDDFPTEGTGYGQGQTFPHPFKLGDTEDEKKNKQNYYDAVTNSPQGNELLMQFTRTAIESEKLGQSDTVDLLCVSFSCNDLIGHCWGPDSQEVLDVTLRSDAMIKGFLDLLDAKVGKGNYYFAMSADHGVCPLPEFAKLQGKVSGRVEPELLTTQAEQLLNRKFLPEGMKAPWFELPRKSNPWIYLNRATIKELKLRQQDVETALATWLTAQPGIERAFTRTELMAEEPKEASELFKSVKRSFHPDGSGDVMVILKPYYLFSPPTLSKNLEKLATYRTTHGTPHPYDTHVPLLVMGPRIVPGVRDTRIVPQTMASILAEALGVPPPNGAEYAVPAGLFKK
jgi:predicted AlkP superfamily pyrophosphatase or phosphodiesterase